MERTGDFVTPREDGMRFMDKPPLLYWGEVAAFRAFGPTPFSARFPTLVAGAALAAFAFLFGGAWTGSRRAAWAGALVLAPPGGARGCSRPPTRDTPLAAPRPAAPWFGWP